MYYMKKNIAIIMGGYSSESGISIQSGNVVFEHLDKNKFETFRVLISREKWVHIDENNMEYPINMADFTTTVNGYKIKFDFVFNAIHGHPGEDGTLLAYFDLIGMPHSSAPFYQMAVAFNKRDCLSLLKPYGIKSARSVYLNKGDQIDLDQSKYVYYVIPGYVELDAKPSYELTAAQRAASAHGRNMDIVRLDRSKQLTFFFLMSFLDILHKKNYTRKNFTESIALMYN